MPIFGEQFIFFNFLHGNLKVNRTVELETIHHKFLVDMYMHPNVKVLKICTFCTKICYLIRIYIHHRKICRVSMLNMALFLLVFLKLKYNY